MARQRVLGLDPGTAIVGWGVVEAEGQDMTLLDYGTIRTPAKRPLAERVTHIYDELNV